MEFSDRFVAEMTRPFHVVQPNRGVQWLEYGLTLDSNNIFNKSLVVDITGDDIEVPSIARAHYETVIHDNLAYNDIEKVEKAILPLYTNSLSQNKRTFNGIIREFFCQVPFNQRLLKITTNKGEIYYGGYGLILDEGFNPLLMCGLKARKIVKESNEGAKIVSMQYYRAICHVSPVVFTEPNKLINRGIIKRIIPLYTTMDVNFPVVDHLGISSNPDSRKVEVIIDDFSKFFITPVAPTPSKCINDTLNKCLNDNIEDILYLI